MTQDISFGTFNLYNLQLPGKAWRFRTQPYTEAQYRAKVKWAAGMLREMNADVIGFQELWSAQCLRDVFEELRGATASGNDYELHFIKEDWYDIAVAAAVRKPWRVKRTQVHKAFPAKCVLKKRRARASAPDREDDEVDVRIDRFSRSVLQLELTNEADPRLPSVRVFVAHLKSKLPTRLDEQEAGDVEVKRHANALGAAISTIRRTAEAAALRVLLTQEMKGNQRAVAVLGDLNDGVLSNTLGIVSQQPKFRLSPSRRTGSSSDVGLYSTALLQQLHSFRDVFYSHDYQGALEVLDHVLVSEQFYDHSKNRTWLLKHTHVWNDHVGDEHAHTSDHGLIAAYFAHKPA